MIDLFTTRHRREHVMTKHPTNISERELIKEEEAAKEGIQGFFWFGQFVPCAIIGDDGMINWQHKLNKL